MEMTLKAKLLLRRTMTEYIQVITTTNTEEEARKIQRVLVEERAVACVQVIGPISSLYWWKQVQILPGESH